MSSRFRIVGPNEPPRVRVEYFYENPSVRDNVIKHLGSKFTYLSQRYWVFSNDPEAKATTAVASLLCGIRDNLGNFQDIDTFVGSGENPTNPTETLGYFTLTRGVGVQIVEAEPMTNTLITATNAQLRALQSPLYLPLEPPRAYPTPEY